MSRLQFHESQPFWKQPVVWPIWLIFAGLVFYLVSNDLIYASFGYVVIAIAFGANVLILLTTLHTTINQDGISYRMRPFHRGWKSHAWSEISHYEVRQYRALKEYGGYGIRIGIRGKAYNVKGKMGLQLVLNDGRRILIGTQKPDALRDILAKLKRNG